MWSDRLVHRFEAVVARRWRRRFLGSLLFLQVSRSQMELEDGEDGGA